jgi:hypothetical protein
MIIMLALTMSTCEKEDGILYRIDVTAEAGAPGIIEEAV